MTGYKQVDCVTESKQRGGYRENSGAKLKYGEKTAVIRLPVSMIERIKQGNFENVTESNKIELVTNSNDDYLKLKLENEKLIAENNRLKESNKRLRAADKDLTKRYDRLYSANERYKKQFEFIERYLKDTYKDVLSQILDSWFTE